MSKNAPPGYPGRKPLKRRSEKLSVRFTNAAELHQDSRCVSSSTSNVARLRMPHKPSFKDPPYCRIKIFGRSCAQKHLQVVDTNVTRFSPSLMSICVISFEAL